MHMQVFKPIPTEHVYYTDANKFFSIQGLLFLPFHVFQSLTLIPVTPRNAHSAFWTGGNGPSVTATCPRRLKQHEFALSHDRAVLFVCHRYSCTNITFMLKQ